MNNLFAGIIWYSEYRKLNFGIVIFSQVNINTVYVYVVITRYLNLNACKIEVRLDAIIFENMHKFIRFSLSKPIRTRNFIGSDSAI